MAIERTSETPYRTNVRPAETRASSRSKALVASGIGVLFVAGAVGGVVAVVNAQKEKARLQQQHDSTLIISGPDRHDLDGRRHME